MTEDEQAREWMNETQYFEWLSRKNSKPDTRDPERIKADMEMLRERVLARQAARAKKIWEEVWAEMDADR